MDRAPVICRILAMQPTWCIIELSGERSKKKMTSQISWMWFLKEGRADLSSVNLKQDIYKETQPSTSWSACWTPKIRTGSQKALASPCMKRMQGDGTSGTIRLILCQKPAEATALWKDIYQKCLKENSANSKLKMHSKHPFKMADTLHSCCGCERNKLGSC